MRKIRKGDNVCVLTGKDKGKRGIVLQVVDSGQRVIVENINIARKHQKANPQLNRVSEIIDKAMPLHISNVAIYNPIKQGPDRIGFKILEDGRKVRVFKSNSEIADI